MRRTNLVLNGEALEEARHALGTKTYSETVNQALSEVVRRHKMCSIGPAVKWPHDDFGRYVGLDRFSRPPLSATQSAT